MRGLLRMTVLEWIGREAQERLFAWEESSCFEYFSSDMLKLTLIHDCSELFMGPSKILPTTVVLGHRI